MRASFQRDARRLLDDRAVDDRIRVRDPDLDRVRAGILELPEQVGVDTRVAAGDVGNEGSAACVAHPTERRLELPH